MALALPSLALAQAEQAQPDQTSASTNASDTAQASAQPAQAQTVEPTNEASSGNYPPCSAAVTDHCTQRQGHSHARAHHRHAA
jgi:hypothetical protein